MASPYNDDALYDEAYGPKNPRALKHRQRVLNGVWDDPTWIRACIDEAYMAAEDRGARRYGWRPTDLPVPEVTSDWISLKEAAALMHSSYTAVYQRLNRGALPFTVRRVPTSTSQGRRVPSPTRRLVRVHRAQVEAYMKGEPLPAVEDADHDLEE